jgi:tRNA-2-methylthio-N6-dimethylallyladenosine synthase
MAHQRKLCVVTFGCQMNKLDSEAVAGHLLDAGYTPTESPTDADVVLINTCSVRQHAEDKVWSLLGTLRRRKQKHPGLIVAVMGCMAQRERDAIFARMPHVDIVCGPMELARLPEMLASVRERREHLLAVAEGGLGSLPRVVERRPNRFQAFAAILRGCDNFCSYCIVPFVRGREQSRPPGEIEEEARRLVADGVREITLLGQNVNSYGRTLGSGITLADLLRRLDHIEGLERLRFVTSHPKDASDELFRAMAELPSVCPHLHMPAQSGSNRVLRDMNRRYTREHYLERVARLRETVPGVEVASDFIVGFPGETHEEFGETVDLVQQVEFQNCFIFKYSPRPGTRAAEMPDDVPWAVKQERNRRLLAIQEAIMRRRNAAMVGQTLEVLVEGTSKHDPTKLTGRSRANHIVAFPGDPTLAGQTVAVEIASSTPLTLFGRIGQEPPSATSSPR